MNPSRYVICDIEATGLDEDKEMIEIALITYQNGKVTDVYETLINPLRPVPEFIKELTSISDRALAEAPKFYEIADAVRLRLEGSVFVSHNTDFDFMLLKKKYQEMGQDLKLKTFCTLKVAQLEIPGLRNYNLDALCSFFDIKIKERHRAIGDARATLELFHELSTLHLKEREKPRYLPQHEKLLKGVPAKAGLLGFRDPDGVLFRLEATGNMEQTGRELLLVKKENREHLERTDTLEAEVTGSALIAEFKRLSQYPYRPSWVIDTEENKFGEKNFRIFRYRRNSCGVWQFKDLREARRKLKELSFKMRDDVFAHRDGVKSKEEVLKHNFKLELLVKETRFPSDNLILIGEGRRLGEKSLVVIRHGHVLGYGYSAQSDDEIYQNPEAHLERRYSNHPGVDLVAKRFIRVLKNMRQKTDKWRSLAEVR